jgi:membrane protein YdbS with pleckstrin-like domain
MNDNELIHQKTDEQVVFLLRRQALVFLATIAAYVLLLALPFVAALIFPDRLASILEHGTFGPLVVLGVSAYLLIVLISFMTQYVDYYLDVWVVTNDRVLSVQQNGLFSRTVSELDLGRVQDVTSEISGVIPSMFNFGNVYIQTAGERERFVLEQVPGADEVRKQLLALMETDQREDAAKAHAVVPPLAPPTPPTAA